MYAREGLATKREVDRERLAEHDQAGPLGKECGHLRLGDAVQLASFLRCKSHHGGIGAVEAGHDVGHLIGINAAEATTELEEGGLGLHERRSVGHGKHAQGNSRDLHVRLACILCTCVDGGPTTFVMIAGVWMTGGCACIPRARIDHQDPG